MNKFWNFVTNDVGERVLRLDGAISESTWWGDEVTLAASAASVIAMAGDNTMMSPVAYMVIHNPATIAFGDSEEMLRAKEMLDEIKEGIINAYERKCKLPRDEISKLMNDESCFNAKKAVELGFADGILYAEGKPRPHPRLLCFPEWKSPILF